MIVKFSITVGAILFHLVVLCKNTNGELVLTAKEKGNDDLTLKCFTTEVERALTWDAEITPKQIVSRTLYEQEIPIDYYYWLRENSLKNDLGPILDNRWENFSTIVSEASDVALKFSLLKTVNLDKSFQLPISVRLELEGHIYICQQNREPSESSCYWIMLGAWNGTVSAIRKCKQFEIPRKSTGPSGNCRKRLVEVKKNPLNKNDWTHFNIIFDQETKMISVTFVDETKPFLQFIDDEYDGRARSIWVNSRLNRRGLWKLHSYNYYALEQSKTVSYNNAASFLSTYFIRIEDFVCISMYISMCELCTLKVSLQKYYPTQVVAEETYDNINNLTWFKIKFEYNTSTVEDAYLVARFNNSNDLASPFLISNLVLSTNCFAQETGCNLNEIGTECIPCSEALGSCEKNLICEQSTPENSCYCGAGSTGEYCQYSCPFMTYGRNCNERCGHCKDEDCNGNNGTCLNGCNENFVEPDCVTPIYPVLTGRITVDSICYTTCNFTFDPTDYQGEEDPKRFIVEYKKHSYRAWIKSNDLILKSVFTLQGLEKSTDYSLRIILLTESKKFYDGVNVPEINFTTSCREITRDEVKIQATTTKLTFSTQLVNSRESCNILGYTIDILKNGINVVKQKLAANITVDNLEPNSFYKYIIYNHQGKAILNSTFKTEGDASSTIKNVKHTSTANSITISWDTPEQTVKTYAIYYEHKAYVFCENQKDDESKLRFETTNNATTINDLRPYSIYKIKIGATGKNQVTAVEYDAQTKPLDKINPRAYSVSTKTFSNAATLYLTPKCELITSPIYMKVTIKCLEIWCKSVMEKVINVPKSMETIDGLTPFSKHELSVTISNNLSFRNSVTSPVVNYFTTKASEPNAVSYFDNYSMNSTSISLRWSPPYPPTGIVEKYRMEYRPYNYTILLTNNYNSWNISENWSNCTIWPMMYCMQISQLHENSYYYFKISAKNTGVDKWSKNKYLETYVLIREPMQPENLKAFWKDLNRLTIIWQHPNRTNGPLLYFNIRIGSTKDFIYNVTKENFTYSYTTPFESKTNPLKISIATVNTMYRSNYNTIEIKTPPPVPKLSKNPKIKLTGAHSVALEIPPKVKSTFDSFLYVVVSKMPSDGTYAPYILKNGILTFQKGEWWIAKACTAAEVMLGITMILGDDTSGYVRILNSKFTNRKLEAGQKYRIYVVLYDEFMEQRITNLYTVDTETLGFEPKTSNSPTITLVVIACILAILVLLGVLVWRYFKRKSTNAPIYDEPIALSNHVSNPIHLGRVEDEEHQYDEPILLREYENSQVDNSKQYVNSSVTQNLIKQYENSSVILNKRKQTKSSPGIPISIQQYDYIR